MRRALITGGAGFVGSHLVRRMLQDGWDVVVLDDLSTGRRSNLDAVADDVRFVQADVASLDDVRRAADGCEIVLHQAALPSVPRSIADPVASHAANATGTLNVLVAAREAGVRRVVVASSSSVYGSVPDLPKRETMPTLPLSPYAVSKLAAESYCRAWHDLYGVETVALRYFNVFGPRQDPHSEYAAVVPRFIAAYRAGEPPVIFGDGEQSRDFTYVANVVDANVAALASAAAPGNVYNIACGRSVTLNELAGELRTQMGATAPAVHAAPRPGEVRHSLADIAQAQADLGYAPRIGLAEGLRATIDAFASEDIAVAAMRYLVTGGAGFIGSHLTDALLAAGHEVTVLDDLSTGSTDNIAHVRDDPRVSFVEGSVTAPDLVDDCMREADVCLHLASTVGVQLVVDSPLETLLDHVRGTDVVMAAAARRHRRVLFTSTSEVYGKRSEDGLREDADLVIGSPAKSRWSYAIAKCFGEAVAQAYHDQHGTETIVVRLFNTVGPRQTGRYGMVLPRFARQALGGESLTVYGDGTQTRCFTHVADTVRAITALAASDAAVGNTYNIGSSTPIAIADLAQRVIARCESASDIVQVPYDEAYAEGFEELGARTPDTSALRGLTGWQAERGIDAAIDDVIDHERAYRGRDVSAHAA